MRTQASRGRVSGRCAALAACALALCACASSVANPGADASVVDIAAPPDARVFDATEASVFDVRDVASEPDDVVVAVPDVVADEADPDAGCPVPVRDPDRYFLCTAEQCGNGRADTCTRCRDGGACETERETCDGDDLAGATCASLGFGAGSLRCGLQCHVDTRGCDPCAPLGAGPTGLLQCGRLDARITAPTGFALASRGDELAVAYSDGGSVYFTVMDASLRPRFPPRCLGGRSSAVGAYSQVSLAPLDGGWLAALYGRLGRSFLTHLVRVSPRGESIDDVTVPSMQRVPSLFARAGGGALMLYRVLPEESPQFGLHLRALDREGRPSAREVIVTTELPLDEFVSAASLTPARTLVAAHLREGITVWAFDEALVERSRTTPVGVPTQYPQLLARRDGARAFLSYTVFGDSGLGVYLTELDASGGRVREPSSLGRYPEQFNVAPLAYAGTTEGAPVSVLLSGHTALTGIARTLELQPVDAALVPLRERTVVSHDGGPIRDFAAAALGSSIAVGWASVSWPGGVVLGLAHPTAEP